MIGRTIMLNLTCVMELVAQETLANVTSMDSKPSKSLKVDQSRIGKDSIFPFESKHSAYSNVSSSFCMKGPAEFFRFRDRARVLASLHLVATLVHRPPCRVKLNMIYVNTSIFNCRQCVYMHCVQVYFFVHALGNRANNERVSTRGSFQTNHVLIHLI